jgi:hypothetical protein
MVNHHFLRILMAMGNHFMFNPVTHGPLFPPLSHGPGADLHCKNRADLPEGHELRAIVIAALSLRVS